MVWTRLGRVASGVAVLVLSGCGPVDPAAQGSAPNRSASASSASASTGADTDRALALAQVAGNRTVTEVRWVRTTVARLFAAFYPPGQRYLGGVLVDPADEVLVVTASGRFPHPMPALMTEAPGPELATWELDLTHPAHPAGGSLRFARGDDRPGDPGQPGLAVLGAVATLTGPELADAIR